jgi:hypothetical protein
MERVKEVLHPSLHVLESARSSTGSITVLPAVPKMSNCPLITAIKAAEEVKVSIFDGRYGVIVSQDFVTLCTSLIHYVSSLGFVIVKVFVTRSSCAET